MRLESPRKLAFELVFGLPCNLIYVSTLANCLDNKQGRALKADDIYFGVALALGSVDSICTDNNFKLQEISCVLVG